MADQGWNLLNRKLLEHNELIDDSAPVIENSLTESTPNSFAQSTYNSFGQSINLNIPEGMTGTVLGRIAEQARSSQAKKQQMKGRRKVNLFLKCDVQQWHSLPM